jgi:hypothetical protein
VDRDQGATGQKKPLPPWLGTLVIVVIDAALMASTNSSFTMLDDESNSIAIAGGPVAHALRPFLFGDGYRELHPPETEIIWHLWMLVTHNSFALLRLPANFLFIGTILFTAKSAESLQDGTHTGLRSWSGSRGHLRFNMDGSRGGTRSPRSCFRSSPGSGASRGTFPFWPIAPTLRGSIATEVLRRIMETIDPKEEESG